jgi:hypothetical protein
MEDHYNYIIFDNKKKKKSLCYNVYDVEVNFINILHISHNIIFNDNVTKIFLSSISTTNYQKYFYTQSRILNLVLKLIFCR